MFTCAPEGPAPQASASEFKSNAIAPFVSSRRREATEVADFRHDGDRHYERQVTAYGLRNRFTVFSGEYFEKSVFYSIDPR